MIQKTFYCNRCYKDCPYEPHGSYGNWYKHLTLCKNCLDGLVAINPDLGEGYTNYKPQEKNEDDCECDCHYE